MQTTDEPALFSVALTARISRIALSLRPSVLYTHRPPPTHSAAEVDLAVGQRPAVAAEAVM